MACEFPIKAYRPANGGPVRFGRSEPKDGRAYVVVWLPCGTCILCREEAARQWAVRIYHESTLKPDNCFLTLTLADKHLPEHNSLDYKAHMQPFWKRLRHHLGDLRYYAVGEYGDKTGRPHYHACVFGHSFLEGRVMVRNGPMPLWTSPFLEKAWGLGNVSVGVLNFETARYTASYVTKKLRSKQQYVRVDEETGELIPLEQPKAYMSLNPAIGLNWLSEYGDQVYAGDYVIINGMKQKPPKYYDRWLEKRSKIAHAMIKDGRIEKAKERPPENVKARAAISRERVKKKKKTY